MDASFCVAKKAASFLPNKRLQNSEDLKIKAQTSFFTSPISQIFWE